MESEESRAEYLKMVKGSSVKGNVAIDAFGLGSFGAWDESSWEPDVKMGG